MIGVVADDTTGALDIGVMFRRAGCSVQLLIDAPERGLPATDVSIIDTDSRLDDRRVAYEKVRSATQRLVRSGCSHFHKKTCSVFRGNIGAEFDAMLDATGAGTAIISAAYPLLGRTTRDGRHFLHGLPLERSALANDPIHPRTTSDLCAIIAEQTPRPCAVVSLDVVRAGARALTARLNELARRYVYLVVDGETQEDLRTLAEAARDFTVFGGSAGLAAEWPAFIQPPPRGEECPVEWPHASGGPLFLSGSLTRQTIEQTACLRESGVLALELDPVSALQDEYTARRWVEDQARQAIQALSAGNPVLISTAQQPDRVRAAQERAAALGSTVAAFGRRVSGLLADLAATILEQVTPAALIVAGGDTTGSLTRRLRIAHVRLLEELEPGIPLCVAHGPRGAILVAFKSGSFGSREFLLNAGRRATSLASTSTPR